MIRLFIAMLVVSLIFTCASCSQSPRLVDSEYVCMGYTFNPSFMDYEKAREIRSNMPTFKVEGDKLRISNDFAFPYFLDSEYKYKISKDSTLLKLKGKSSNLEMKIEFGPTKTATRQGYTLYIDNEYLEKIDIIEDKR